MFKYLDIITNNYNFVYLPDLWGSISYIVTLPTPSSDKIVLDFPNRVFIC